jgi:tetratricopeptide (TPR) repeat protein
MRSLLSSSYRSSAFPRRYLSAASLLAALILGGNGAAWAHGSHDELVAEITAELATRPDDAQLHFRLADANCEHGDWEIALENLKRVEQLAPGKFPTDFVRGRALLAGGQVKAARAALDRFLARTPQSVRALTFRARANQILGDTPAALADFDRALAQSSNPEPDLFEDYAEALVQAGRRDAAIDVLSQGIDKLGSVPSLVLSAMQLEVAAGRIDAALSRIDAMQISAPRPEPWMAKRAALLARAGRTDQARASWEALVAHLASLPNLERGSHAMSMLAAQAQEALAALRQTSNP